MNLHRALIIASLAASPLFCHAQACLPSYYGAQLPQGATACIQPTGLAAYGNYASQPMIYTTGLGGQCDYDIGYLYTSYAEIDPKATLYPHSTLGFFTSLGVVQGGVINYIDWNSNILQSPLDQDDYEGGAAILTNYQDGIPQQAISFTIAGVNPSLSLITSALNSYGYTPWFFGRTLSKESSNRQFYGAKYAYTPIYGQPDGFGLTQLDASGANNISFPKLVDEDFWQWDRNLLDGVLLAVSDQNAAYSWLNKENTLAAQNGVGAPIDSAQYGTCQWMQWSGTGRNGVQDAEWITEYNSGHYATFYPGFGWRIKTTYIEGTCNSQSLTIPN